jgi:hypothetical protein
MRCDTKIDLLKPDLQAGIAVLEGESAMSVRCLFDPAQNEVLISSQVPKDVFEAASGHRCRSYEHAAFKALASRARPIIGLAGHVPHLWHPWPDYVAASARGTTCMVAPKRVHETILCVPQQTQSWTCGVNSAARFAAMLGQSIKHYHAYRNAAPKYGGGIIPNIGPNPEGLKNHLCRQSELQGTQLEQKCHVRFHGVWEAMIDSVNRGRPALALLMNSQTQMHWVTLVGKIDNNWWYMDTNHRLYEIPGGDEEMHHLMNMGNCWAQKLGFVERFNAIVATGACCEKD